MTLRKCRACSYWVERGERSCPNCGIFSPSGPPSPFERDLEETVRFLVTILSAFAGLVVGVVVSMTQSPDDLLVLPVWALSGLLLGWLLGDPLGNLAARATNQAREKLFPSHDPECLIREEEMVRRDLSELARRERMIRGAKQQVTREPASKDLRAAARSLDKGARAVSQEAAVLHARLWEIAAERWENQFVWLSIDPSDLAYGECAARVQALSAATVRIEAQLRNWDRSVYATTEPGRAAISRMRALVAKRGPLKAALLAHTSAQALGGVSAAVRSVEAPAAEAVVRKVHSPARDGSRARLPDEASDATAAVAAQHPEPTAATEAPSTTPPAEPPPADAVQEVAPPASTVVVQRTRRRLV